MPEGDVVWLSARRLHEALADRVLIRTDVRVPRFAAADLTGRGVAGVVSRGKHLLIRVTEPPRGGGAAGRPLTIHTHLRMEGAWRVQPTSQRITESHRIRLILANETWQAIGYRLGLVEILPTAHENRVVGHLGPDLLGPDWDGAEAVRRLSAHPARAIGEALLDQRSLAGIGNLYKSETLFLRGISPWRATGDVTDLEGLVTLAQRLLDANKTRAGQVTTGVWQREEQSWVYGRAGRPCRRCGTPIRKAEQGSDTNERATFWCPRCQTLPAAPPPRPAGPMPAARRRRLSITALRAS